MLKTLSRKGAGLALITAALASAIPALAAEERTADKIQAELKAVEMPKIPANREDQKAVQQYYAEQQKAVEKKVALIGELYKVAPENPDLVQLLPQRWNVLMMMPGRDAEAKAELEQVLAKAKNPKLVNEAAFFQVVSTFRAAGPRPEPEKLTPAIDAFTARFPKDERGAMMLSALASLTDDPAKKDAISRRLEKDYPNSPAVRALAGERRQKEGVGKPFEISFVDAIKGDQVSSKTLMGKVVVIDFWATWCGPCIAEMPKMKELYARYKDQGVEFVGVSLDSPKEEGGYDKLKQYVEKNKIEWPQFYQGKGWESEFSGSWGVNSIPCVFLVDAEGKLASTQARGQLEEMIPQYLEKAKKAGAKP